MKHGDYNNVLLQKTRIRMNELKSGVLRIEDLDGYHSFETWAAKTYGFSSINWSSVNAANALAFRAMENKIDRLYTRVIKRNKPLSFPRGHQEYNIISRPHSVGELKAQHKTLSIADKGNSFLKCHSSKTKADMAANLFRYMWLTRLATAIQCVFRGHVTRRYLALHGPAIHQRELCVNTEDCVTMDALSTLSVHQFFSYADGGHIYGFDVGSFYGILAKGVNPYTRAPIGYATICAVRTMVSIGTKVLKIPINISGFQTSGQPCKMRALMIFQAINALGFQASSDWFLVLTHGELVSLWSCLQDIWHSRIGINIGLRRDIYPPHGRLCEGLSVSRRMSTETIRNTLLDLMSRLVFEGINEESRYFGALYVLGAFTMVSFDAAQSIPWLADSFAPHL